MAKPVHHKTASVNAAPLDHKGQASAPSAQAAGHSEYTARVALPKARQKYVTDATLASVIDSSRSTVWRYVQQGILPPPIKIGGLTRFDLDHALACIRAGKVCPAPCDKD